MSRQPDRERFSRLDLAKRRATSLTFSALYPWNDQLGDLFGVSDEPGFQMVRTSYTLRGQRYNLSISVLRFEREERRSLFLSANYQPPASEDEAYHRDPTAETNLVKAIESLNENAYTSCTVQFALDAIEEDRLWFPLPSRVGGTEQSRELFEIRGVRGAKIPSQDDQESFQFILDRPEGGTVYLRAEFAMMTRLLPSLGNQILDRASEIATRLAGA